MLCCIASQWGLIWKDCTVRDSTDCASSLNRREIAKQVLYIPEVRALLSTTRETRGQQLALSGSSHEQVRISDLNSAIRNSQFITILA